MASKVDVIGESSQDDGGDDSMEEEILAGHNVVVRESAVANRYHLLFESAMKHFRATKEVNKFSRHEWRGFFSRTFDVFLELWSFLSRNASTLLREGVLKQQDIAEVASKIGQLFYHTYVQSSDIECLQQACHFYSAVQSRKYCDDIGQEQSSKALTLRLRYLARFISVALLLGRSGLVDELVKRMEGLAGQYQLMYPGSTDAADWKNTAIEAKSMLEALGVVQVPSCEVILEQRHPFPSGYVRPRGSLALEEAVLVSCTHKQVRFSQLSLDMMRMLYALEVNAHDKGKDQTSGPAGALPELLQSSQTHSINPRKCLLYRPSVPEFLAEFSAIMKDSSSTTITLLYLSCDGTSLNVCESYDEDQMAEGHSRQSPEGLTLRPSSGSLSSAISEDNLFPSDLVPFTRRAMFLIVDSVDAPAFKDLSSPFHQPFVSMLSASRLPADFADYRHNGRLLTLFLACPLTAFCHVCNLVDVTATLWSAASEEIGKTMAAILDHLHSSSKLDADICLFLDDFFTRSLICCFVFSQIVVRHHYAFPNAVMWPTMHPPIPDDVIQSTRLLTSLMAVAASLDVQQLFE